jgi:hypothetical protein
MSRKFNVPVGLVALATDPASGASGEIYFNTVSNKLKIHNGTSWGEISGGGGGASEFYSQDATPTATSVGAIWLNTTNGKYFVWMNDGDSSQWVEIGAQGENPVKVTDGVGATASSKIFVGTTTPSAPSVGDVWIDNTAGNPTYVLRWRKVMSGGETSLSGNDVNGLALVYSAGYEQLYINGVLQYRGSDYTATTGTTITGISAMSVNDVVEVIAPAATSIPAYTSYSSTAPSTPAVGQLWVDTGVFVPNFDSSQMLRWKKTLVGGETSLSGNADDGLPLSYTPNYEQLYLNGILLLRGVDYVATTGNTVTGLFGIVAGDVIEVFSAVVRTVADVYTQAQSDSKYSLRNGPAFSAYASSSINIAQGATTKVGFQTEEFDTNNNYDTTLSRFTPTVAGYYQITAMVTLQVASAGVFTPYIYKNGTEFKLGATQTGSTTNFPRGYVSSLVYANGTTDYFEIFATHGYTATVPTYNVAAQTYFTAAYVRGV